jgi:hypothetical protein
MDLLKVALLPSLETKFLFEFDVVELSDPAIYLI